MIAIVGLLIGVCCGVLIAVSAYTLGRIHERESIREVYDEAADIADGE